MQKKAFLLILDGFGEAPSSKGNAVKMAKMPFLNSLKAKYPFALLEASGNAVGLPDGVMGASEPGHMTIGAGRVVFQPLEEINQSIRTGEFGKNKKIVEIFDYVQKTEKPLHLLGMISDAGVHSNINHLFKLLEIAKEKNLKKVFIHCILDGRDVHERSANEYLGQIQEKIDKLKIGKIASICGRYFAMDRDKNWDRTQKAYDLLVNGKAKEFESLEKEYPDAETDYYVQALKTKDFRKIEDGDAVVFWNFRSDRSSQLSSALIDEKFSEFETKKLKIKFLAFGPFTELDKVAFPPPEIKNNLGEVLSKSGKNQLRIAETEKYAHVTFFFNSQVHEPFENEDRILVNSPKCKSYAEKPEMSAEEVTQKVLAELDKEKHDFIALNFANPDLVGHSGSIPAVIQALEFLDGCVEKIVKKATQKGFEMLIIADHGNAEEMLYPGTEEVCPAHTTNKVPCILVSEKYKGESLKKGKGLSNIAPTILKLMDIKIPKEMTGDPLF